MDVAIKTNGQNIMTAKEEAKGLHREYYLLISDDDGWNIAKQCALICIKEIKASLNKLPSKDLSDLQYWGEVEHEIGLL